MKKVIITILLFPFLGIQYLSAQNVEVSGVVKNDTDETIAFANVFLLKKTDSTFISGSSTDEKGNFIIKNIKPDSYLLQASYVGNTSEILPVSILRDTVVGVLKIKKTTEELDEVVVNFKQPTMERKSDRLIFNVENTAISQGASWDILKHTPGVIVSQDNLQIRNKDATIYLNNRKLQLSSDEIKTLLEGFSGVNIKSIEVIANPPAEYEAEDGPILNIITSKNLLPGYKGSVNGTYTQANFAKYSLGTSHYIKGEKLNFFFNYNISPKKQVKFDETHEEYTNDADEVYAIWDSNFKRVTRSTTHSATTIIDYDFNSNNSLNVTSNLTLTPNKTYDNNLDVMMNNGAQILDSTLITTSDLDDDANNLGIDVTYKHKFNKEGASLSLSAHYTTYNKDINQYVYSQYFLPDESLSNDFNFSTDSKQDIQIKTAQLDYTSPINTVSFSSGFKVSDIDSESGIDFYTIENGLSTLNNDFSDVFRYDETIFSGYVSAYKEWEKWSTKIGLRGEYTDVVGVSNSVLASNTQEYFKLFPSAYLNYVPSENHSFSFDYSRKVVRPKYQELNPFSYFINENYFNTGNPNLVPAFSSNFNFNYTLKDTYYFDLYFRDNGENISTLSFQDNVNQTIQNVSRNVIDSYSYGFDFNYGKSISNNWYLASYISIFHEDVTFIAEQSDNVEYTNGLEGVYAYLANYLTLSKDGTFTGDIGVTYLSGFINGDKKMASTTDLTMGLRKSLWNKRAVVTIAAEDVLSLVNYKMTTNYLNQNFISYLRPETQFVRFGFTYNFGNFRLKENNRELNKNERDRLKGESF
ncbi:TonB-dependent receptor [Cellulophaga baltica]|uniref:outer membrane beta-barrel family protein n=1 Tax=Cellulophaga TaxID=104264 RepID=UPI001C070CB2|nr:MULTISPECIES: outer membrane beta-barrel family protein [Cellulophaga]MBU2995858.1 TonB-dependent receptor [Cellulophaga baltica]MDO6767253.1 outer membrane beta-barrel family protein [Cellulophaga sp. 1_MG-2023]